MRMLPPLVVVFTGLAMVACGNGGADRGSPAGHETIPRPPPPQSGAETPPEDKAAEAPAASWVQVTAGTFQMGSPAAEGCRENGETRHEVTLSQAFEIQSTEVTQGQFADRMGYNPSHFHACGLDCPVETVTWHEAAAYCNALSAAAGLASCYTCSGSGKEAACTDTERHAGAEIYSCP